MSLLEQIQRWVKEPPPEYLFEISESGIAAVETRNPSSLRVRNLPERALAISPAQPNFVRRDLLSAALATPANGSNPRRKKAALVIPDYATRMSVLDFEELPADPEQRTGLVRFRLRKSVPFGIDEAQVSCSVQLHDAGTGQIEVLAAAISRPVLDEYEQLLSENGFQAGLVIPSSLAALALCAPADGGITLFAKLSGSVLSILLLEARYVRLVRCVDLTLEEAGEEDEEGTISTLLQQTLAFSEDELNRPVQTVVLCGFGDRTADLGLAFEREFGVSWAPLRSRLGPVLQENAGLLGLLEQYIA